MSISKLLRSQGGQIIVAVVFLMVIVLGMGVSISNRYIRGLSQYTRSDDSSRALSIAEALVERVLIIPNATLEDYITFNSCGSNCHLEIQDVPGRIIEADATLSYVGESSDPYRVAAALTESSQVLLEGYGTGEYVYVCWDNNASLTSIYIFEGGGQTKADAYSYNSASSSQSGNGFSNAAADQGHQSCFTVTTRDSPKMLRLKAFYEDTDVFIISSPGQVIPRQGILITSVGKAGDAAKTVQVVKSEATLPGIFDYVLYQKSLTDPLSN